MNQIGKRKWLLLLILLSLCAGALCRIGVFLLEKPFEPSETVQTEAPDPLEELLGEDYREFLTQTITMQMENRMVKDPDIRYYPIAEQAPLSDYIQIGKDTAFEIDQEGYLVIIFPAGTVADAGHGEQRFRVTRVIPSQEEPVATESDWMLLLVNPQNRIPEDFSVTLTQFGDGQAFDERAYPDLQDMLDGAIAAGLSPVVCSSYRTEEKQTQLYENKISRLLDQGYSQAEAEAEAAVWVAVPGTSEHQLGLAVDIIAESYPYLDEQQENTAEQKWLMENAHRYGFILRYPADKSQITQIGYEPWHYRYVGKDAAKEIYESGLCLEEYLQSR